MFALRQEAAQLLKASSALLIYEKGIFQTLSDSIRLYTRYKENFDVVNGPLSDPYYEFNQLLPRHFPSFIGDKLDDEFQRLLIDFSQKTSYVHRHNLQGPIVTGKQIGRAHV